MLQRVSILRHSVIREGLIHMNHDPTTEPVESAADYADRVFQQWCDLHHLDAFSRNVIRNQCLTFFAFGLEWGRQHPEYRDPEDIDELDEIEDSDRFA
jgi:hypothetical protein